MNDQIDFSLTNIAVVGMAGRFPGSKNLDQFWRNLVEGVNSVTFFSLAELEAANVDPDSLKNPLYVKAGAVLEDIQLFDASFFGYTPREAEIMDPQHRLFLECAWEALEHAGYDCETYEGRIGVYSGASLNHYLLNVYSHPEIVKSTSGLQILIGNKTDHLATRVSYKLNLRGPSLNIQCGCSTSLVAACVACQSLLSYQCDMALAGGVSIQLLEKRGYLYEEGGILSLDGYCRAFDANAGGTVGGDGVGVVVLKRLSDAQADGDYIHAVIRGSAINNDGSFKVGYTAPSVDGQAVVITEALAMAQVEPETVSYVETHGTGTIVGDPIEIAALTKAFRTASAKRNSCAIGSVKTNIGHLDTAAGIAGLIKTTLSLKHKKLPPSLHCEQPNPSIDFANSPFFVNTNLSEWETVGVPRRAGVSSFSIGGTNAHVILEEWARTSVTAESRPRELLILSAKTESALEAVRVNLLTHLREHPEVDLASVAYTLQVGRQAFSHRSVIMCRSRTDAIETLEKFHGTRVWKSFQQRRERPLVMMFSGQGTQYGGMARELYRGEKIFREQADVCVELLKQHLKLDLGDILYPETDGKLNVAPEIDQTAIAQPALFVIEYALAHLWMKWGIHPEAMIGQSIGEYVAACLAGVMSLEDALFLVATRGQLMQKLPRGSMLAVFVREKATQAMLETDPSLSLAAVNSSSLCVISGPTDAVSGLEKWCQERSIPARPLRTSHAFHSQMMEPVIKEFTTQFSKVKLNPPKLPFISNLTGTWITPEQATSPDYWAKHLRQTVRFADGIVELLKEPERLFLEVGPGRTLTTLVKEMARYRGATVALSSLGDHNEKSSDLEIMLQTLGQLWLAGVKIDWAGFHTHEERRRVPLPTYPFERKRYWLDGQSLVANYQTMPEASVEAPDMNGSNSPPLVKITVDSDKSSNNQNEETIRLIWQEVLGIESISLHDDFFELGGDSLVGIQLMSRLRTELAPELTMSALFESPTIAGLAAIVSELQLQNPDEEELELMLAEIEKLSPEEVDATIATVMGLDVEERFKNERHFKKN
jgi:phthiocerol/phenolphthiocerol synthesis type-I polyketide synthase E